MRIHIVHRRLHGPFPVKEAFPHTCLLALLITELHVGFFPRVQSFSQAIGHSSLTHTQSYHRDQQHRYHSHKRNMISHVWAGLSDSSKTNLLHERSISTPLNKSRKAKAFTQTEFLQRLQVFSLPAGSYPFLTGRGCLFSGPTSIWRILLPLCLLGSNNRSRKRDSVGQMI